MKKISQLIEEWEMQEFVNKLQTRGASGDITASAEVAATSEEVRNTAADPAAVEPPTPAPQQAKAGSGEIDVDLIATLEAMIRSLKNENRRLRDLLFDAIVERVFQAIAAGAASREQISEQTGISYATVWKATNALIDWPGGPRIEMRRKEGRTQFFYAV